MCIQPPTGADIMSGLQPEMSDQSARQHVDESATHPAPAFEDDVFLRWLVAALLETQSAAHRRRLRVIESGRKYLVYEVTERP
jgi:hypothetical protein